MYERFFGLQERPFDLTADPRFLFRAAGHREALSNLQYGISGQKGVTLLVGEAGTGKTTIVRLALQLQRERNVLAAYLNNPTLTRTEFYEYLTHDFGLSEQASTSKTRFLHELNEALTATRRQGGHCALVVDEAQSLPDELLEEVRLLANLETHTERLLAVILSGQPELGERLNRPSLRQLKQRVALRCVLAPLNLRETAAYIAKRISVAGGDSGRIFTREAVEAVFTHSRGIPRTISVICDNSLVTAFALERPTVGADIVLDVCRDFDLAPGGPAVVPQIADVVEMRRPTAAGGQQLPSMLAPLEPMGTEQPLAAASGDSTPGRPGAPPDFLTLVRRRRRFSFF